MKYLHIHREKYYFKRKLPNTRKNIVISLQTADKLEANFITAIINARISPIFKDTTLDFEEELDLIQSTVKEYVLEAKDDYGYYAEQREKNYKYTTKKGSVRLGSHPKAISKAITTLTDMLHSPDKAEAYKQIVTSSNMIDKFSNAYHLLSDTNQDRMIDEVIKGEIELLHYAKERNEQRVKSPMNVPTYLDTSFASKINMYNAPYSPPIQQDQTQIKYYSKTARELLTEYIDKLTIKEPQRVERSIDMLLDIVDKNTS